MCSDCILFLSQLFISVLLSGGRAIVFNATFNNIPAISWGSDLLVDKGNNKITELRTILQRESPNS